jgi:hypothetical protein
MTGMEKPFTDFRRLDFQTVLRRLMKYSAFSNPNSGDDLNRYQHQGFIWSTYSQCRLSGRRKTQTHPTNTDLVSIGWAPYLNLGNVLQISATIPFIFVPEHGRYC